MDKSWILSDRLSHAYEVGVGAFVEFAHSSNPKANSIQCPCTNCINVVYHSIETVRFHLFAAGFEKSYRVWLFHGERHSNIDSRCSNKSFSSDFEFTRDILHDAFTHVEKDPNSLKNVLEECEKPHYEDSKYNSLSSFELVLAALRDVLPPDNRMPKSLYEAKNLLKGVDLEYEKNSCK
ncbi:hypothetical protein LXL04_039202 [Taraxacum kok-saghyz]